MAIPTNLGSGGPTLQSIQDGNVHDYQGVVAVPSLSHLASATSLLVPLDVVVDHGASGDLTLVAAQGAGKIIHVLTGVIVAGGDVSIAFWSNAAGTKIAGPYPLTANSGFSLPFAPIGHFRTQGNQALVLNLSASQPVGGHLVCVVE